MMKGLLSRVRPKLRHMGAPVLRKQARSIEADELGSSWLNNVVDSMWLQLSESAGVGLAAPQIGESVRVVVVSAKRHLLFNGFAQSLPETVLVNPKLTLSGDDIVSWESCLSVPHLCGLVRRKEHAVVDYIDWQSGEARQFKVSGVHSAIVQHETDHLDGVLYLDRMSAEDVRANLLYNDDDTMMAHELHGIEGQCANGTFERIL
jgi:peptide deformylase